LLVEEHLRVDDIARELIPPPAHQLLVVLGDGEPAIRLAVAVSILIVEEARRWREELGLLDRLHIRKVEVALRAPKTSRRRVVRARRQLRRVVRAEREAEAPGAKLGVVRAVGLRPDAMEAGRPVWRGNSPTKEKWWRRWRVEERRRWAWQRRSGAVGKVLGGWCARAQRLYSARVSRRDNIWTRDRATAPRKKFFPISI
jgi:hypothetical protein